MKVLHLIDSAGLYGAEIVLLYLMKEQKKKAVEPVLGSIGKVNLKEKDIERVATENNIDVKKFHMGNGPNLLGAISIIRFAKQNKVSIIHCHGYKANILMGILPAVFRKTPYLFTLHGWTSVKKFSKMWFYGWADAFFAKRAGMVVAVSNGMCKHPQIITASLKPVVIHNGIPQLASPQRTVNILDSPLNNFCNKSFVIGAIGRLSPEKGFDFLVNAVADIINAGYNISLVIIGQGKEQDKLKNIVITRGISNKVFFAGYLENASKYIKLFDIFAITSLTEGLPVTLLEAMQAGVAIVATNVGGIPEVLGDGRCGILVKPKDGNSLSKAILKLHDSPRMRKRVCFAAKKRVKNEFSSEAMERNYRELYKKMLLW